MNIESCSGITIKWLFYRFTRNRTAITNDDIDEFVSRYCAPGAMRAGFEYYRAFPINEEQNKALSKTKLQIPVLALGGVIYPALGGDAPVNFALDSTQGLAENVKGVIVPLSGHYIAEEQPEFLADQLSKFFGNNTQSSNGITIIAFQINMTNFYHYILSVPCLTYSKCLLNHYIEYLVKI